MDLTLWLPRFTAAMEEAFGERLLFLGLQGSRARGEAQADSDIDTVVILDRLTAEDLAVFRAAVETLPYREKLCGFVSSAAVLRSWDRGEFFGFIRNTVPLKGDLLALTPPTGREEARKAVHAGTCALYHACCHNLLYDRSGAMLAALYKSARFVLRAKVFADGGEGCPDLTTLRAALSGEDREILERYLALRAGETAEDLDAWGGPLLAWAERLIVSYEKGEKTE